jgi:XTP/dITP diphosphohydrolase
MGKITTEPRGTGGFGFDPIFQPQGTTKTYAEMTLQEKNLYSHRAKAAKKLAEFLTAKA